MKFVKKEIYIIIFLIKILWLEKDVKEDFWLFLRIHEKYGR
jgi:hypothetical protein